MTRRLWRVIVAAATIAIGACSPSGSPSPPVNPSESTPTESAAASPSAAPTSIRVRLPGALTGEFAGYIAAQKLGYFSDENLAVNLLTTDPASPPADYYNPGATGAEFTIAGAAPVLAAREHDGSDLVNIAQIFQRSGTVLIAWTHDVGNPADICALGAQADFKGKKVGLWPAPADLELASSFTACSLATPADYTRVEVGRDASALLSHSVDAIQGERYDQLAQVLEATNPTTNQQYTTSDVTALPPEDHSDTLQDGIYASKAWLAGTGNRDTAVEFIRAVTRGWIYCRDHQDDCVQFTTQANPALGTSDTRWAINEVNGLIWPSLSGIGAIDQVLWQRTITVATAAGLISKPPTADAFDDSIGLDVASSLSGDDLSSPDYQTQPVAVAPGGR